MPDDPVPDHSMSARPVPDDLPLIEVDVNGAWRQGRLRAWEPRPDGLWADVTYQNDGRVLDRTFPADQVRPAAS